MIIPTREVARLAACVQRATDGMAQIMAALVEDGVHICGPMGFDEVLKALDEAQIILEAVVTENSGGNDGQSDPS